MLYTIFLTVIVYTCLIIIGSNLLYFIVSRHSSTRATDKNDSSDKANKGNRLLRFFYLINILCFFIAILYYYFIYQFFNAGMVIAAAMLMTSGAPKIIKAKSAACNHRLSRKRSGTIDDLSTVLSILALPVVFISFCCLE